MDVSLATLLIVGYLAGGLITLGLCIKSLLNIRQLVNYQNINLLSIRPDLKRYLILKPIFWPYFFATEKILLNVCQNFSLDIMVMNTYFQNYKIYKLVF